MAIGQMENVLKHLRRILAPRAESGASDGELLERFFVSRDEAAFELLVWRYHRMVLGVCSRILADSNDVEDAFQATFLILSRKGGSIRKRNSLSSWLFGVARRVALEAGRGARSFPPSLVPLPASCPDPCDELIRRELPGIFDEELGLLPEKYRAVIVLCYLEGRTYEEAGQHLGCSKGTVSTRLTRARELLRTRLAGRGLALSAGALAGWMCEHAASAGAPSSLISHTIKTVTLVAAGKTAAAGPVSAKAAALTEGVLKAMLLNKLKTATAVLLLVVGMITVGGGLYIQAGAQEGAADKESIAKERVKVPLKQEEVQEAEGKKLTVDQAKLLIPQAAGISNADFKALSKDPRPEVVKSKSLSLAILAHLPTESANADMEKEFRFLGDILKVSDITQAMWISKDKGYASFIQPNYITDCTCKSTAERAEGVVTFKSDLFAGHIHFVAQSTKDGWGITEFRMPEYRMRVVRGKDGVWVQEVYAPKGGAAKKSIEKEKVKVPQKQEKEQEDSTAWGKEVGGLQAGLSIGNASDIRIGGKATVVIRLRNVSNQAITVSVWLDDPRVVDAIGKRVRATTRPAADYEIIPTKITVKVGQTVEMSKSHFLVTGAVPKEQPVSDKGPYTIYVRPGTYKADFGGFLLEHHTLFTGPVEFTVKDKADPPAQKEEQRDTAWGKEVGGLQAGLGYKPGGNRVYKHGESVTLVVRVRNVGKEEVKFEYLRQYFIETPPAVTDGSGKPVRIGTTLASGEFHKPVDVTLAPGKGIELAEWNLDLLPEKTIGNLGFPTLYGTGKFRLHYARVIGETSAGPKLDPALSKLATGTLELDVRSGPPAEKRKP